MAVQIVKSEIYTKFAGILNPELAKYIVEEGKAIPDMEIRKQWYETMYQAISTGSSKPLKPLYHVKKHPVTFKQFVELPEYMDSPGIIFPKIMDELVELNSGRYVEAVLTGSIGCGKTTMALWTQAYQVYLISCYENPHEVFGLDPSTEIMIVFQSISASLAKAVDYARFRSMLEKSPYFNTEFPFQKDILSEIRFPNRIIVKPISGEHTGAIGQNVFSALLDEMNFMAMVERSRMADDGGTYDQATQNYNSIASRRKSRFMKEGVMPGILCIVSSKRYPGQFTDEKIAEAQEEIRKYGKSSIFVYDKTTWDVMPDGTFTGSWFKVFAGTESKKPRILEDGEYETLPGQEKVLCKDIPLEYRPEFERDIMNALRDIAGVSTMAKHPFIVDLELMAKAFGKTENTLTKFKSTLTTFDNIEVIASKVKNLRFPRFVHVDLAISGDSAGLVMGHVPKFVQVSRGNGQFETLPYIVIDAVLEIPPPPGGEILFHRIREVIYALRSKAGLPIHWVTLDSFQSKDTMQILKQQGFATGLQSMDTTNDPYEYLKGALYDQRIEIPDCHKLKVELAGLEVDVKNDSIDHPPKGCFLAKTPVLCYDGTAKTMEELVQDYEKGIVHTGVSWDIEQQEAVCLPLMNPRITKYVTELVEVEMENGEVFTCTPDHLHLLKSGEYVEAEKLVEGQDLQD